MKLCEKFNFATKLLVEANLERQIELRQHYPAMGAKGFAKEFCTVKISSGRRSGSTYTTADIALSMFEKPLIISKTFEITKIVEQEIKKFIQSGKYKENMYKIGSSNAIRSLQGIYPDSIIVDCASIISQEKIEEIYDNFSSFVTHNNFCFIFLG